MNYKDFKGLMRSSAILVKRLMEQCGEGLSKAINNGTMHQYLYSQVDTYLQDNGVKADRKSINVLTDLGKELFITSTVEDLFFKKGGAF